MIPSIRIASVGAGPGARKHACAIVSLGTAKKEFPVECRPSEQSRAADGVGGLGARAPQRSAASCAAGAAGIAFQWVYSENLGET